MNTKKEPPQGYSLEGAEKTSCSKTGNDGSKYRLGLQASVSSRGVSIHRRTRTNNRDNSDNLKRRKAGDIATWSTSSRRKFRRFLMDWREPIGWFNYSHTLTVPGPVLEPKESKELWDKYARRITKRKILVVWRAEVQKRGAMHWHCIASLNSLNDVFRLYHTWWECIEELGAFENHETSSGVVVSGSSRMALNGAFGRSVRLDSERGGDCWWRYLCDHASKSKQEQVGENIGRHWGVFGRKWAVPAFSEVACRLSDGQAVLLDRFLRRLRTPRVKDERNPFGYRLGWAPKMSRFGRSDYFGHQSAVKRYLDHIGAVRG